jgi:hypothetical protein
MATNRTFSNMLNEYLPLELLQKEAFKRDWILSNVEHDESWLGGNLIVPFLGAIGSSVKFGSLTAANDIAEEVTVRGTVSAYKELHASMIFNETDLKQHGKLSEQTFLKILPDAISRHATHIRGMMGLNLLNGGYIAKASADGDVSGNITVANPERFEIGMKVQVVDGNTAAATGYVKTINMNTGVLNIVTARGGATPVDLSGYTVAQDATIYNDDQASNAFKSLKAQLLPASAGGDSAIWGVTKTAYPYTQAIAKSGSDITASNILQKIFDFYVELRTKAKGQPFNVVMSYKNFGSVLKVLEQQKGAFNVKPGSQKTNQFGWTEVEIGGFAGMLKLVAIQECDSDVIMFLDLKSMKLYSNGGLQRRKSPDGISFFEVRNTSGFQYIVDHAFYGEFVVHAPCANGILHSISYS